MLSPARLGRGARPAGREAEIARLAAVVDATAGGGHALLVHGEAGIGKTRLVAEIVRMATERGTAVVAGQCVRGAGAPYRPLGAGLRRALRGVPRERLAGLFAGPAAPALVTAPDLATDLGLPVPSGVTTDDVDAGVWHLVARLSASAPVVVVLDDLQWAAPDLLRLLGVLVTDAGEVPLLVAGAYRDEEIGRGDPLSRLVTELTRSRRCDLVRVGPLDRDAVRRMLGALPWPGPGVDDDVVDAVHARTGGNPFFIEELCASVADHAAGGEPRARLLREVRVPQTVRDLLLHRLDHLDGEELRALRVAAVSGGRLDPALLREAAGVDDDLVRRLLVDGLRSGWLVEHRDGPSVDYAFRHELVKDALVDELVGPERADVHRRVAEAMLGEGEAAVEAAAGEVADHLAAAGDRQRAQRLALVAARRAIASGAPREAANRYLQAIRLLDPADDAGTLALALEAAEQPALDVETASALVDDAERLARRRDDRVALARALAARARVRLWHADNEEAVRLLRAAAATVSGADDRVELRVLVALAHRLALRDARDEARALLARAFALAGRLGDPSELARLHTARGFLGAAGTELEEAFGEAIAEAERSGDPVEQVTALLNGGWSFMVVGEVDRSRELMRRAAVLADESAPHLATWIGVAAAAIHAYADDVEAARTALQRWGARADDPTTRQIAAQATAEIALRTGNATAARTAALEAWDLARTTGESLRMTPAAAALARSLAGVDPVAAAAHFEEAMHRAEVGTARYLHWLFTAEHARLLAEADDVDALRDWVDRVRALTALTPGNRPNRAALEVCEAILGAATGDHAGAVAHAREAVVLHRDSRLSSRELEAWLLVVELLDAQAEAVTADEARAIWDLAGRVGSPPLAARTASLLRGQPLPMPAERPPGRGGGGLSVREREVALLAADGLTNAQIATRLFLSETTARNHVSNVLAKLGLRRRVDLARWAAADRSPAPPPPGGPVTR